MPGRLPGQGRSRRGPVRGRTATRVPYRDRMGLLILILLAALIIFMVVSAVIAALHVLFWVALVLFIVFGALRLSGSVRRRSRR